MHALDPAASGLKRHLKAAAARTINRQGNLTSTGEHCDDHGHLRVSVHALRKTARTDEH